MGCYRCNRTGHVAKFCTQSNGLGRTGEHTQSDSHGKSIRCYSCGFFGHIARFCPQSSDASDSGAKGNTDSAEVNACCLHDDHPGENECQPGCARVSACFVVDSSVLPGAFSRDGVFHAQPNDTLTGARASDRNEAIDSPVAQAPGDICEETSTVDDESISWEFGQLPSAEIVIANERKVTSSRVIRVADVRLPSLQCIDVIVEDVRCIALLDSVSQIPLISDVLFQRLNFGDCGHINIRGMFSDPICVPLADVIMKRVGGRDHDDVAEGLPVMCAVVSLKDEKYDVVLPPDIATDWNLVPVTDVMDKRVNNDHVNVDDQTNDKYECVSDVMNVVVDDDDVNVGEPSSVTVSNDMKDKVVDNVIQLLTSDEGRVESDVRLDVVHTVDNVVTGEAKYYDDAGRGDDNAGGGDCVAVTNCGDVMHAHNNIAELLFIVLVLLKFTGRAV